MTPLLPETDIWHKAFSRQVPEPLVVHAFTNEVRQRRVYLLGVVRQTLLALVRDERQFARLSSVLASFPHLSVLASDHVEAAAVQHRLRRREVPITARQALLWAVARRASAQIWSHDRAWLALAPHDCPLRVASANG